ncbi:MAG: hypothetical protein KDC12_04530 [Flavobacteriales bacterium]|nr:hypothetical protein [Flavobacteriales bacterium]
MTKFFSGVFTLLMFSFMLTSCLNDDNLIPPNCYDGEQNNGEEEIDCGGPCPACDPCLNGLWNPENGETWVDCGGECGECDQCANGCQDGDEVGVDCGGTFCGDCADLCDDGLPNGDEDGADPTCIAPDVTLADCGGDYCDPCPTCDDLIMNGQEIGIDCGGTCGPCPDDSNCLSGSMNGGEFWIDCGGPTCPACQDTLYWNAGGLKIAQADKTFNFDGSTFTITGTTFASEQISMVLEEPGFGWLTGAIVTLSPTSLPANCTYTDAVGFSYSTALTTANMTFTVLNYVPGPGGVIVMSFAGTTSDVDGVIVNISNGFLLFNIP